MKTYDDLQEEFGISPSSPESYYAEKVYNYVLERQYKKCKHFWISLNSDGFQADFDWCKKCGCVRLDRLHGKYSYMRPDKFYQATI